MPRIFKEFRKNGGMHKSDVEDHSGKDDLTRGIEP